MSAQPATAPLSDRPVNKTPLGPKEEKSDASLDTSTSSDVFEPLHQGGLPNENLERQRQLLQKKLAEKQEKFASPTDNMMSPCTAKLQAHKKKQFGKTKPMLLSKTFAQLQQENK